MYMHGDVYALCYVCTYVLTLACIRMLYACIYIVYMNDSCICMGMHIPGLCLCIEMRMLVHALMHMSVGTCMRMPGFNIYMRHAYMLDFCHMYKHRYNLIDMYACRHIRKRD